MAAVLAVMVVAASSASALATTTAAEWYTGATGGTTLAKDLEVKASIGVHPEIGEKFTLHSTIGKQSIDLTATGVECIECFITNEKVTSNTTTAVAMGKGKIKFTGVTAMEPEGCTVRNKNATGTIGVVETTPIFVHADFMHEGKAFQQWFPQSGAGTTFATIYIEGGKCEAIEGPYNVTGSVFSEAKNPTSTFATTQEIVFSQAIQETAAGTTGGLSLGTNAAQLTGTGKFKTNPEVAFGIK
jgi:hypothetical protein